MDAEYAKTIELKEKLEPLTGIPVKDQELVFDDTIMKGKSVCLEVQATPVTLTRDPNHVEYTLGLRLDRT